MYISGKLTNNLYKDMNRELEVLADWFHANKLYLNVSKQTMLFSRFCPVQSEETVLMMSYKIFQPTHCTKFLCLKERLDWQEHISQIEIAKCMYSYIHSSLPVPFSNIFTFTHDIHNHDTRQPRYTWGIHPTSSSSVR